MEKSFKAIYPSANSEFFVNFDEMLEKFISGHCFAMTPAPNEVRQLELGICGQLNVFPEVLFSFDESVPINQDYIKVFNNYITVYKSEGIIDSIFNN